VVLAHFPEVVHLFPAGPASPKPIFGKKNDLGGKREDFLGLGAFLLFWCWQRVLKPAINCFLHLARVLGFSKSSNLRVSGFPANKINFLSVKLSKVQASALALCYRFCPTTSLGIAMATAKSGTSTSSVFWNQWVRVLVRLKNPGSQDQVNSHGWFYGIIFGAHGLSRFVRILSAKTPVGIDHPIFGLK